MSKRLDNATPSVRHNAIRAILRLREATHGNNARDPRDPCTIEAMNRYLRELVARSEGRDVENGG
jgi:hypothetical protein